MQRPQPTAEAAERAFYAAMADGDLDRMMALWADDDATVCHHPGGPRLVGRAAIRDAFREIFATGGVRIDTAAVHAWSSADVAVHSLIEQIAVEGRDGTEVVEVVATNVWVRAGAGWRLLVHHAGVTGVDDESDDDEDEDGEEDDAIAPFGDVRRQLSLDALLETDDADEAADPARPPRGRLH